MQVTVTSRTPGYSGTFTLGDGTVLTFTNGYAGPVDISYADVASLTVMGYGVTVSGASPTPPYDANYDAVTQAIVSASTSQTTGALRAAYARPSRLLAGAFAGGRYVGFGGDSITAGTGSTNSSSTAFVPMAAKTAGTAHVKAYNGGVAGDRSDQLLARMDAIIGQGVNMLSVMIGTNDASQGVPLTTFSANIQAIVAKARAAAIPIALSTVPPFASSSSAATHLLVSTYNLWLRLWCPLNGIPLIDAHGTLVDPATGYLLSTYDGGQAPHPNDAGHLALGKVLGAALQTFGRNGSQPTSPWPVWGPMNARGFGLLVNPLVNTTANWSGVSTGTGTVTAAAPTGGDLPRGNWLSIAQDNTGGGSAVTTQRGATIDATKWTVGDVLLCCFYAKSTDPAGAGLKVQMFDQSNASLGVLLDTPGQSNPGPSFALFTVPSGPTALRLVLSHTVAAGANTTSSIGAADVFNLTALGLTSLVK